MKPAPSRRDFIAAIALAAMPAGKAAAQEAAHAYSLDQLIGEAKALAGATYGPSSTDLPPALTALDFDAWRNLRFRPNIDLLGETRDYDLRLFHRGFLYRDPMTVFLLRQGNRVPIAYSPDLFDFGSLTPPEGLPLDFGFAGFRLHYPLNSAGAADETISFLGASYFRFLSRGQHYGLSARGLAINAGIPGEPEEFPAFRQAIIHAPQSDGRITLDCLLDSPSAAGAYRFVLQPGQPSVLEVEAHLFARRTILKLGIAPLTSMFLFGENGRRQPDEYRPELHDSDGLLMHTGTGEWLWRPLRNPQQPQLSSFQDENPKGFGLMQRDRTFEHYQDLDLNYHQRPGYWVTPIDSFGQGSVELVELPTTDETNDNIVASWRPRAPLPEGAELTLRYKVTSLDGTQTLNPGGYALNTFRTAARARGAANRRHHAFHCRFCRRHSQGCRSTGCRSRSFREQRLDPAALSCSQPGDWRFQGGHRCCRKAGRYGRSARILAPGHRCAHRNLDISMGRELTCGS
jgi:periplasmic glucans biosynthesis protein